MIVTGARGSKLPAQPWEVVKKRVCIYWKVVGADEGQNSWTSVWMTSQLDISCNNVKVESNPPPTIRQMPRDNRMTEVCYTITTSTKVDNCIPKSCSCPFQLKAQVKTDRFTNDMGLKIDNTVDPPVVKEVGYKGEAKIEKLITHTRGGPMPKGWMFFSWDKCVGTAPRNSPIACPGTEGVTE